MNYVRIININNSYTCDEGSNLKMELLGLFLADDISWHGISFVKNWVSNKQHTEAETNITALEKQGDYIILRDLFPQKGYEHASCAMTIVQFSQLINDWEKIWDLQPKKITIICNNDQFTIETDQ